MQQVHTATARRLSRATSAHSGDERARDDRRRYGSCRRARRPGALRKLSARETTGGATEAVVAREAALGPAGGARPVARATGRPEYQPVRVTSALKKGPRATSAEPAETSRWSETSGASCRVSQEPAVPRDKRAQKRTSHQKSRPRGKRARAKPNIGCTPGTSRGERRNSRMAESGRPDLRGSCLLRH